MSFILDALKKSESDRQRQSGPALFEVKVAPPKARFPVWAIAIVALLVVNMIIVGWMLLRRSSHGEDTTAANTPPAATSATNPAGGAVPQSAGAGPAGPTAPPPNSTSFNNTPPTNASPGGPAPGGGMSPANSQPGSTPGYSSTPAAGYPQPGNTSPGNMSAGGASPAGGPATGAPQSSAPAVAQQQSWPPPNQQGMGTTQGRMPERDQNEPTLGGNPAPARQTGGANVDSAANPDDYAPAAEPGSPLFKGHVKRGTESGLVLYQDAALTPGANLPQLRLDLHVYAAKPQDRFALINMHRMHEGDSLQDGVRVEAITPDGVVMSHNGSKFLLPRE
jgi:general secretion pathway protein B